MESIYLNVEAVNTHREKPEVGVASHPKLATDTAHCTTILFQRMVTLHPQIQDVSQYQMEQPAPTNTETIAQT